MSHNTTTTTTTQQPTTWCNARWCVHQGLYLHTWPSTASFGAMCFLFTLWAIWGMLCFFFASGGLFGALNSRPMDVDLRPLFLGLRKFVITSRIFVLKASWRNQNVAEVFSYNRGISHLHSAHHIDDVSRFPFRVTKITTFSSKKVW
jgi:hypothetical protein